MTKENKDILLKYLCMALPYGVICNDNRHGSGRVTNIDITPDDIEHKNPKVVLYYFDFDECGGLDKCKPFLRPMLSMTDEEKEEMHNLLSPEGTAIYGCGGISMPMNHYGEFVPYEFMNRIIQYLLKNHFDFMGLIPKDLAIEVTEENNPYKE